MCGYPYSGKTTLAKFLEQKLGFARITVDEIVQKFGLPMEEQLPEEEWTRVYQEAESRLINLLTNNRSVIFDATNGHKDYRDKLRKITESLVIKSIVVFINTPLETIYYRDAHVSNRHKATGVENTIREFNIPTSDENVVIVNPEWGNDKVLNIIRKEFATIKN